MTLLQIEYFTAVAKYLSFTKAANSLYISQPVLSRRIAAMEAELNLKLFYRESHSVRLTQAGNILYEFFTRASHDYADVLLRAQQAHSKTEGELTVGLPDYLDTLGINIYDIFSQFKSEYPHTTVHILQQSHPFWIERVSSGEFDLIFTVSDMVTEDDNTEFIPLIELPRKLYYAPKYFHIDPANPSLKVFDNTSFFSNDLSETPLGKKRLTKLLLRKGIRNPHIVYVPTTSAIFANVGSGFGVTVMDEAATRPYSEDLCALEIDSHILGIFYRTDSFDPRIDFLKNRLSRISLMDHEAAAEI